MMLPLCNSPILRRRNKMAQQSSKAANTGQRATGRTRDSMNRFFTRNVYYNVYIEV